MADAPTAAGLVVGSYELLSRLDDGGMGEVFIARQRGLGKFERLVAVKLLLPHLARQPDAVRMFLDEARNAGRMNHPNIVSVLEAGEARGRYFIAMSLVEGVSLSALLKACRERKTMLPLPIFRLIAVGLCEALSYAHGLRWPGGEGIVHRDISPSNVLLSAKGAVQLGDFGLAKAHDNTYRTESGLIRGKYAYASPEQLEAGDVGFSSDVYSATVTLFETLTGTSPFRRESDVATLDAVRHASVPEARTLRPEVSEKLSAALACGMARTLEKRFESARELREALSDGPIAQPYELGELLQNLFPDRLEALRRAERSLSSTSSGSEGSATRTIGGAGVGHRKRRQLVGALLVVAALAGIVGLWSVRLNPKPGAPEPPRDLAEQKPVSPPQEPIAAIPAPASAPANLPEIAAPQVAPHPQTSRKTRAAKTQVPRPALTEATLSPLDAPSDRIGYLTADAVPWAWVYLNGRKLERTPFSRFPIPPGRHVLVFKNPQTGQSKSESVSIVDGKVSILHVRLTP
jgi:eukaryotic-like serine/threonine-protein kinase